MWPNPQFPAYLVTFTEEILNRKLYFLCSQIEFILQSVSLKFFEILLIYSNVVSMILEKSCWKKTYLEFLLICCCEFNVQIFFNIFANFWESIISDILT